MAGDKHKNRTTWEKGKSGNGESLTELCRAHTADAIKTLVDIMGQAVNEPKDRIAAAVALLDRGWGKPKEAIDVDARVEGGLGLPVIQILRYADAPGSTH